jgi:ABC-2 type transport system ATP-binding protein
LGQDPAIDVRGLTKSFGGKLALSGLTMTVPRGEVFGFLGPNGAGKTTAVRLLLGLSRASAGEGAVLGAPLGSRAARRRIGYLPELFRYQGWLRAGEVLALHGDLAKVERSSLRDAIPEVLHTAGLAGLANQRVDTFSKGMQQRLGLAVALLGDPELVLLDEPTSALDPVGRHDVREILRRLKARGVTVFLNSHLLSEVEQICDRAAVVDHGRVVAQGSMAQLLQGPTVRIRCSGISQDDLGRLGHFGSIAREGEWITIAGPGEQDIPAIVAAIVALGGSIFAVDPGQQTLEERFLQLVEPG